VAIQQSDYSGMVVPNNLEARILISKACLEHVLAMAVPLCWYPMIIEHRLSATKIQEKRCERKETF
jgi:hypothetical protein